MIELFGAFILGFFTAQVIQVIVERLDRKQVPQYFVPADKLTNYKAYDPLEDEERRLRGETESYFD
jgi:hypothetical protein